MTPGKRIGLFWLLDQHVNHSSWRQTAAQRANHLVNGPCIVELSPNLGMPPSIPGFDPEDFASCLLVVGPTRDPLCAQTDT